MRFGRLSHGWVLFLKNYVKRDGYMTSHVRENNKKISTIFVISCLVFSSVISIFLINGAFAPSTPEFDNSGNMIITGGKTVLIEDYDPYSHSGDILVNASSTLIIRNCTFKMNPDTNHPYTISVIETSKLIIENSVFTVDTNAIQASYFLRFDILDSTIEILNSSMIMPGTFNLTDSTFRAVNSKIEELSLGYGSPVQIFNSSYVYYEDCSVEDFKVTNPIRLLEDTEFIAINTFFDLDYNTKQMTIANSSHAELYGITINTGLYKYRPINILHGACWANIYRWLEVKATDKLEIPIGGTRIDVKNVTAQSPPVPSKYILDYLGKEASNFNYTNSSGLVLLPLMSDNLTYSSMPNAIFVGNYKLTGFKGLYTATIKSGLPAYPVLTGASNNPNATLHFKNYIIKPNDNPYFSNTPSDIIITDTTGTISNSIYQKPQGGVVDLSFGHQGNIIVNGTGVGGNLKLLSSKLGIEQDPSNKYYILIEENGKINVMKKSAIKDGLVTPGKYPINIFMQDSSELTLDGGSSLKDVGALSIESGSSLILDNSQLHGNIIYGDGAGEGVTISCVNNSKINVSKMSIYNGDVTFRNTNISLASNPVFENINMNASNSSFTRPLTFSKNSKAYLINVTQPGFFNLSAKDTSVIEVFWLLTVVVKDSQGNPLEDADVYIRKYEIQNNELVLVNYKQGKTDSNGRFTQAVLGGIITSTGRQFGGLISNYYLEADYYGTKSTPGSSTRGGSRQSGNNVDVFGGNQEVEIIIPGTPDIAITKLMYPTPGFKNQNSSISANISNIGDFTAFNVEVEFWDLDLGILLGKEIIEELRPKENKTITVTHKYTLEGDYEIKIEVDPMDKIEESIENNNIVFQDITIESLDKPDLMVVENSIISTPSSPISLKSKVKVSATIKNIGTIHAYNFKVTFRAYYLDEGEDDNFVELGNEKAITSLAPLESEEIKAELDWEVLLIGNYSLRVIIDLDDLVGEYDEENNNESKDIEVVKGPDLEVIQIEFNPAPPITRESKFTIIATIINHGPSISPAFKVGFYINTQTNPLSEPMPGPALAAQNTTQVSLSISRELALLEFTDPDEYRIYVKADPKNEISETNDSNNVKFIDFDIIKKADLAIAPEDITFSMTQAENGINFTIFATIKNLGETVSNSYKVIFYDVHWDPNKGGKQISDELIQSTGLSKNKVITISTEWSTEEGGWHNIWAEIESETTDEEKTSNNRAFTRIYVKTKPDLYVMNEDITTDKENENPLINDIIEIFVTIKNAGDTDVKNFEVDLYDNAPGTANSKLIGSFFISDMLEGNSQIKESKKYSFKTAEVHEIWVVCDPTNIIEESNENNNSAHISIDILPTAADLLIEANDITIYSNRTGVPVESDIIGAGENYQVEFRIQNLGSDIARKFNVTVYLDDETTQLETIFIDILVDELNETGLNTITLMTKNIEAIYSKDITNYHNIYINIDPEGLVNESEKDNNYNWSTEFQVIKTKLEITNVRILDETSTPIFDNKASLRKLELGEYANFVVFVKNTGSELADVTVSFSFNGANRFTASSQEIEVFDPEEATTVKYFSYIVQNIDIGADFVLRVDVTGVYGDVEEGVETTMFEELIIPVETKKEDSKKEAILSIGLFDYDLIVIIVIIAVVCGLLGTILFMKKKREKMAECSECGALIPIDAIECPKCGAEFSDEIECGECGALMKVTDTTCPVCGAVFTKEGASEEEDVEGLAGGIGAPGEGLGDVPAGKPPMPGPKPAPGKPKAAGAGVGAKPAAAPTPTPPAAKPPTAPIAPAAATPAEAPAKLEEEGEEKAECYRCGAIVPLSASMCPECGAEFE
jgi:subtilase family serine protease/RNA polymerase subunit RPABC4/transcription elongation factor Spt4